MDAAKVRPYFLLLVVAGAGVLTFLIFRPLLTPLALAAISAVILQPVLRSLMQVLRGRRALAALGTVLFGAVVIVLPLFLLGTLILNQAVAVYNSFLHNGTASFTYLVGTIGNLVSPYIPAAHTIQATLAHNLGTYAQRALEFFIANLGGVVSGITGFFLGLVVFFIALYYLLKDGPAVERYIVELSPLANTDDRQVLSRLTQAINSVIRGNLTIALIQGVVSGIGFAIFGLPNAVLWGTTTAFAALIPGVGTSLVIAPAVIYLFATGPLAPALGLLVWGILAVGMLDNFLGPRLIGRGARLHPLVIMFSVLGGLAFFGPSGLFLGPITVSLLVALLSIYSAKQN